MKRRPLVTLTSLIAVLITMLASEGYGGDQWHMTAAQAKSQKSAAKPLPWNSQELAALSAYRLEVQTTVKPAVQPAGANPCAPKNPCGAQNPWVAPLRRSYEHRRCGGKSRRSKG